MNSFFDKDQFVGIDVLCAKVIPGSKKSMENNAE